MPKKIEPTGFAQRLKQLREAAGLTQDALADKAGLYKFSIAKLEQGVREPTWGTVQVLARALGVACAAFEEAVIQNRSEPKPRGRPRKPADAPTPEATPAPKSPRKRKGE